MMMLDTCAAPMSPIRPVKRPLGVGHHWYVVTAEMVTGNPTAGVARASPFFVKVTP